MFELWVTHVCYICSQYQPFWFVSLFLKEKQCSSIFYYWKKWLFWTPLLEWLGFAFNVRHTPMIRTSSLTSSRPSLNQLYYNWTWVLLIVDAPNATINIIIQFLRLICSNSNKSNIRNSRNRKITVIYFITPHIYVYEVLQCLKTKTS